MRTWQWKQHQGGQQHSFKQLVGNHIQDHMMSSQQKTIHILTTAKT
jgi:hypothetical protein